MTNPGIRMYGAAWCRDCRRTRAQLDGLGIAYEYVDIEGDNDGAEVAERISGRKNIPVVVYPDGTHQVEPSNPDVEGKLRELALL
jgi:mycoredoxin